MNKNDPVATCSICPSPAWGGTKRRPTDKCFEHFACDCPECGHIGFFLKTRMKPQGRWVCFGINCQWTGEVHPHPERPRTATTTKP